LKWCTWNNFLLDNEFFNLWSLWFVHVVYRLRLIICQASVVNLLPPPHQIFQNHNFKMYWNPYHVTWKLETLNLLWIFQTTNLSQTCYLHCFIQNSHKIYYFMGSCFPPINVVSLKYIWCKYKYDEVFSSRMKDMF